MRGEERLLSVQEPKGGNLKNGYRFGHQSNVYKRDAGKICISSGRRNGRTGRTCDQRRIHQACRGKLRRHHPALARNGHVRGSRHVDTFVDSPSLTASNTKLHHQKNVNVFIFFWGMIGFDNRIVLAWCKREFRDSLITRKLRSAKASSGAIVSPFQVKDLALAYA